MSNQNLNIVFKNTTRFELTLQQKLISSGEWAGSGPPESIARGQQVMISASGDTNLQGYFIYITKELGPDYPLAVTWRYQEGGQPGHLVTASRENFLILPPSSELLVPTAGVAVTVTELERRGRTT